MRKTLSLAVAAVLLCGVVCVPPPVGAQSPASQVADPYAAGLREFEEFVAAGMKNDRIPGMTVGFFRDEYTWVKGFGYADLENRTPAHAESAYRLASITKSMTGEAIVQLAERGKIDLDAEIQTYVPDYPVQKWPVTVRNLLTHTGGGQVGARAGARHAEGGRGATFLDLGGRWLGRPQFTDAGVEFVGAGVALHPRDAALRVLLGDFLVLKGKPDAAAENYQAAYNIDPALAKGLPVQE